MSLETGTDMGIQIRHYRIRRFFVRHSYPRNGNVHNPTKVYSYVLYSDGMPTSSPFSKLKDAKAAAEEWSQPVDEGRSGPVKY